MASAGNSNKRTDHNHIPAGWESCFRGKRNSIFTLLMEHPHFSKYYHSDLSTNAVSLAKDYYSVIEHLCEKAELEIMKLDMDTIQHDIIHYAQRVNDFIDELRRHIHFYKETFSDYLLSLHEKGATNHNCSQCSGRCEVQHTVVLMEFNTSVKCVEEIRHRIQSDMMLLYNKILKETASNLHYTIIMLNNVVKELSSIEKNILIPKIKEIQKKIHVRA